MQEDIIIENVEDNAEMKNEAVVDRMVNNTELQNNNQPVEPVNDINNLDQSFMALPDESVEDYIARMSAPQPNPVVNAPARPYDPASDIDKRMKQIKTLFEKNLGIKEARTATQYQFMMDKGISTTTALLTTRTKDKEFNKIRDEIVGRKAMKPEEIKNTLKEFVELKKSHNNAYASPRDQLLYEEECKLFEQFQAGLAFRGIDEATIRLFEAASYPANNIQEKTLDEVCKNCANNQKQAIIAKSYLEANNLDTIIKGANKDIDDYFEKMDKNHFTTEIMEHVGEDLYSLHHYAYQVYLANPEDTGAYNKAKNVAQVFEKKCLEKGMPQAAIDYFKSVACSNDKPTFSPQFTAMPFEELKKVDGKSVIDEFYGKLARAFEANKYPAGAAIDSTNLAKAAIVLRDMNEYKKVMAQTNRKPTRALIDKHLEKMRKFLEVKGLTKDQIAQLETVPANELKGLVEAIAPKPSLEAKVEEKTTTTPTTQKVDNPNRIPVVISNSELEAPNENEKEKFTEEELSNVRQKENNSPQKTTEDEPQMEGPSA